MHVLREILQANATQSLFELRDYLEANVTKFSGPKALAANVSAVS